MSISFQRECRLYYVHVASTGDHLSVKAEYTPNGCEVHMRIPCPRNKVWQAEEELLKVHYDKCLLLAYDVSSTHVEIWYKPEGDAELPRCVKVPVKRGKVVVTNY